MDNLFIRSYAAQLRSYRDHCDSILSEVESALNHLQDLQQKHLLVSTKTGALHEACEQLLQDQVREKDVDFWVSFKLSSLETLPSFNSQIKFVILLIVNHTIIIIVRSENLVLNQLIISKLIFFFVLITYLVDIVLIL